MGGGRAAGLLRGAPRGARGPLVLTRCAVGHPHVPPPLHPAEGPRGRGGPHGVRTEVGSFFFFTTLPFPSSALATASCRRFVVSAWLLFKSTLDSG